MFDGNFAEICVNKFPLMLVWGRKLLPFHKSSAWSEDSTELSADVTEDEPVDDPNSSDHSYLQPCCKLYVCTPGRVERY